MSIYAKEFLAVHLAFEEFELIFWVATKLLIIMTDSKSITRLIQTKMIRPHLWNACDFGLQFNFTIAHIPGKKNTAADFLTRLEIEPNEKIVLKIREDILTKLIEVNIESTGIAREEPVFLDSIEQQVTTEKQKKNFGNVKNKHEMPYVTIYQSSHCRLIVRMT